VKVKGIDDSKFPECTFTAEVMVPAESTDKQFKLMAKNKTYKFAPVLKMKKKVVDLKDQMTRTTSALATTRPAPSWW